MLSTAPYGEAARRLRRKRAWTSSFSASSLVAPHAQLPPTTQKTSDLNLRALNAGLHPVADIITNIADGCAVKLASTDVWTTTSLPWLETTTFDNPIFSISAYAVS